MSSPPPSSLARASAIGSCASLLRRPPLNHPRAPAASQPRRASTPHRTIPTSSSSSTALQLPAQSQGMLANHNSPALNHRAASSLLGSRQARRHPLRPNVLDFPPLLRAGSPRRAFGTSRPIEAQKLLWSGTVLDQTAGRLRPVSLDWMEAVGIGREARSGIRFTRLASSPSHTLLAFVTVEPSSPSPSSSEAEPEPTILTPGYDVPFSRSVVAGRHSVVSIGRNSYGELGLGFASQEATWGLVSSGFEGQGGVGNVRAGSGFSWIVTRGEEGRAKGLYACGNGTVGQTGDGDAARQSNSGEPQLVLASRPKKVDVGEAAKAEVLEVACGIDHSLVLVSKEDGSTDLLGCGLNTDFQLTSAARGPYQPKLVSLLPAFATLDIDLSADPIVSVAAGGDTTFVRTSAGRLFGWGNNEYAQVGGRSDHDEERLELPTEITTWVEHFTGGSKAEKIVCGGSYMAILDEHGRVFTAGYGPLGLGQPVEAADDRRLPIVTSLLQVPLPRPVTGLSASLDHVVAWNADEARAWSWGLDSAAGRGSRLASDPQEGDDSVAKDERHLVWEPREIEVPVKRADQDGKPLDPPAKILDVAAGADALWILVEDAGDEDGLRGTWRGPGEFAEW